jgi:hypothetical protein
MSAKHFWIILASDCEPRMREAKTAREALARESTCLPGGYRSAVVVVRTDLVRPGPQSALQAVACGFAARSAGATRSDGALTAYIGAPATKGRGA